MPELIYQSEFKGEEMDARFAAVAQLAAALEALTAVVAQKYVKPASGIPSTDMDADVQAALAKANSAVQSLADYYTKSEVDQLLAAINGMDYVDVAALPTASASTLGKIYLVGPDASGYYAYYYTSYDGSAYSWVGPLGTTQISLANYATKAELSQLDQKVDIIEDGEYYTKPATLANGTITNPSNVNCVNISDYIPVNPGDVVYLNVEKPFQVEGDYYCYGYRTYKSNKTSVRDQTNVEVPLTSPMVIGSTERYIRFTIAERASDASLKTLRVGDFNGTTTYVNTRIKTSSPNLSEINAELAAHAKSLAALTNPVPTLDNHYVTVGAGEIGVFHKNVDWFVSKMFPVSGGDVLKFAMPSDIGAASNQKCGTFNATGELIGYITVWDAREVTLSSGNIAYVALSVRKEDADAFGLIINGSSVYKGADLNLSVPFTNEKLDQLENALKRNAYKQSAMSAIASQIGFVYPTKPKTHYLCFIHQSDIHGDVPRYERMLAFANSQDNVAAILNTGDYSQSSYDTEDFENTYVAGLKLSSIPNFPVVGNHDVSLNGAIGSGDETIANVTARYITPYMSGLGAVQGDGAYYYKDFTSFKIRLIVLCEYELPRIAEAGETSYKYNLNNRYISQDQATWLVSTLNSVPEDYGVIIALHSPIDTLDLIDNDFTCSVPTTSMGDYGQGPIIQEIVDAWITKSTLSKTYANTLNAPATDVPDVTVSADFTNAEGEFVCYLTGHTHRDYVGTSHLAAEKQICICISCGTISRTYFSMADDLLREADSQSEDLFNMIAFDTDRKQIRILRVGASQTADMRHREMTCIPYGES